MAATDSVQTTSTISLQVWFALLHDVTLPKSCPMTEQAVYSTVFLLILRHLDAAGVAFIAEACCDSPDDAAGSCTTGYWAYPVCLSLDSHPS